jgi:hypothetical protein
MPSKDFLEWQEKLLSHLRTGQLSLFSQMLLNSRPLECSSMEVAIMLSKNLTWVAYYGGADTALIVLSEVSRAGKMRLGNVKYLHSVARQEENFYFCHLLDLYDSGAFERLDEASLALTARILRFAFAFRPSPTVRGLTLRDPLVSSWSLCLYANASATAAESHLAIPSNNWPRVLMLSHGGLLCTVVYRLVSSRVPASSVSCESRLYSAVLRRVLNVAFPRKLLKHCCLPRANAAPQHLPASRHTTGPRKICALL